MIKTTLTAITIGFGLLAATNVDAKQSLIGAETMDYKANMAQSLQRKLMDPMLKQALIAKLAKTNEPILYSNLLGNELSKQTEAMLDSALTKGIYPEVWLHTPEEQAANLEPKLIAYAPNGDEDQWQSIPAIELATGEVVELDVEKAPAVPVLVVETHGKYSMQNFVTELNLGLQQLNNIAKPEIASLSSGSTVETTKLTKISLEDDEEPWIKGDAEIFTFVAGVFDNNQPAIKAVGLPYLDHDGTNYYPNQLIINWSDYRYNAVNFSLYEEDSETNYKELAKVIVTAVGAIGSLAGFEPAIAIAEITNRIQDAMPDSWYTDDHDYVDTCYTLVKGESLNDQWCARRNAKISTRPFILQSN